MPTLLLGISYSGNKRQVSTADMPSDTSLSPFFKETMHNFTTDSTQPDFQLTPLQNRTSIFDIGYTEEGLINCIAGTAMTVLTFLGQALVFGVVYNDPRLRTPGNYFIISLASADLLISVISMPVWTIYSTLGYWPFSPIWCDLWNASDYVLCVISIYTIMFISVDRYLTLRFPFTYPIVRTAAKAKGILVGIWVFTTILFGSFIMVTQKQYDMHRVDLDCSTLYLNNAPLVFIFCVGSVWFSVVATLVLYIMIYRIAKSAGKVAKQFGNNADLDSRKPSTGDNIKISIEDISHDTATTSSTLSTMPPKLPSNPAHKKTNKEKASHEEKERKAAQTIALLLIIYAICWMPISFVLVAVAYDPSSVHIRWVIIGYWFGYLNSTLNPVCYAVGNPFFRETMILILCGKIKKKK